MVTLSICIPSYNRFWKLVPTVKSILLSECKDFELVVVDNGSKEIPQELLNIKDDRYRLEIRKEIVTGPENFGTCQMYAKGLYTLLLLDKDTINGKNIERFVSALKGNKDIYGGYVIDDKHINKNKITIYKEDALYKFSCLFTHPSGLFWKTDVLQKHIESSSIEERKDAFNYDVYLTECASKGSMMIYDYPLIERSTLEDNMREKSKHFNDESKMYFFPDNIIRTFKIFKDQIDSLNLDDNAREKLLQKLYNTELGRVTVEFESRMADINGCTHYHINSRKVTKEEMDKYAIDLENRLKEINIDQEQNNRIIANGKLYLSKLYTKRLIKSIVGQNTIKTIKKILKKS